jgi:uncharacterized membrane protein YkvA (DUF1232 family)
MWRLSAARRWAKAIKRDAHTLWIAARDPRTPRAAKWLALLIAAYALSPIDLIPDFIPVIGYLDDLVIVPLGILLVVKLMPPGLIQEYRETAALAAERPVSKAAAAVFVAVWVLAGAAGAYWLSP